MGSGGMGGMNGLGSGSAFGGGLGTGNSSTPGLDFNALTQAYSGIQQYAGKGR